MITIHQTELEVTNTDAFMESLKENIVPVRNVYLNTPVKLGMDSTKKFGGTILEDGNSFLITRSKYFFLRFLPKLVLIIVPNNTKSTIEVKMQTGIFTFFVLLFCAVLFIGTIIAIFRGEFFYNLEQVFQFFLICFLFYIETKVNLKELEKIKRSVDIVEKV